MLVRRHGQAHSHKNLSLKAKLCLFNIEQVMRAHLTATYTGRHIRTGQASARRLRIGMQWLTDYSDKKGPGRALTLGSAIWEDKQTLRAPMKLSRKTYREHQTLAIREIP